MHRCGPVNARIEELAIIRNSQDIWVASGRLRGTNGGGCRVENANSVGMCSRSARYGEIEHLIDGIVHEVFRRLSNRDHGEVASSTSAYKKCEGSSGAAVC